MSQHILVIQTLRSSSQMERNLLYLIKVRTDSRMSKSEILVAKFHR